MLAVENDAEHSVGNHNYNDGQLHALWYCRISNIIQSWVSTLVNTCFSLREYTINIPCLDGWYVALGTAVSDCWRLNLTFAWFFGALRDYLVIL